MNVKIHINWYLLRFTNGQMVVETAGQNVGQCLENLEVQCPGIKEELCVRQGELDGPYSIYINSTNLYTVRLAKPVKENDELAIQFIGGGG